VVPTEHGSWAFLGEPLLLGLLVAPSGPGALVGVAAVTAFLARQPLRLFLGDRRRGRRYPRTAAAERAFAVLAVVAAAALAAGLALARGPALGALGLGAPLAALALAFDLSLRSRAVAAEVAGAVALGATAAAVPLAAGHAVAASYGLWGVVAIRVVTSVLFVRARLRLDRGEPAPVAVSRIAQAAGLAAAWALAVRGLIPGLAAWGVAALALRAVYGLSPWRPRMSIPRFGATEVAFGLLLVALTAAGARSGR
jgi:hypothetical protein